MNEYQARTTRPLRGYHLSQDRETTIPGGALVTVIERATADGLLVTATAVRLDGPYGINLNPDKSQIKPLSKANHHER